MSILRPRRGRVERLSELVRIAGLAGATSLCACQSYEARPLDPTEHLQAWRSQSWQDLHDAFEQASALVTSPSRGEISAPRIAPDAQGRFTLDLEAAQDLAVALDPDLRSERMQIVKTLQLQTVAGLRADPTIGFEAARNVDSGDDAWRALLEFGIPIPLSDRLRAEEQLASAEVQAALAQWRLAAWECRAQIRASWLRWSALQAQAELCERYLEGLEGLVEQSRSLVDAGEMDLTEANLFVLERARWENTAQFLRGQVEAEQAALRIPLGLPAQLELQWTPKLETGQPPLEAALLETLAQRHPQLLLWQRRYDQTEAALRLEIERQTPDLSLGPRLERDGDFSWLGLTSAWVLPLWHGNRPAIAAARLERAIARVALEAAIETLAGQWHAAEVALRIQTERTQRIEGDLLPLLEQQLQNNLTRLALGEANPFVLLESLQRAHEARLDGMDARLAQALAENHLRQIAGPPPPTAAPSQPATSEPPSTESPGESQ